MSPTIHDVARRAGCSIKTVSRVLNQEPHVRPILRDRVASAIAQTGYIPNLTARRLVQRRPGTLGLIVPPLDGILNPYALALAFDLANASGYDLLLHIHNNQPAERDLLSGLVSRQRLEGIVIAAPCETDPFLADLLAGTTIPRVFMDPLDREKFTPSVAADDQTGVRDLTTHLLDAGHRRIAFLKGPPSLRASHERLAGYTQALAQRGIAFEPRLAANTDGSFIGGYNAVRIYLSEGSRPTAFVAFNDTTALGALFALHEMNVRVPREISVCGYGDLPVSAQVWPGLTTVRHPAGELMEFAFRSLIQILAGKTGTLSNAPPPTLVLRGSSGPGPGI